MRSTQLANSLETVGRIQRLLPTAAQRRFGDTVVAGPWRNTPYEAYVPGLDTHVVVGHLAGTSPGTALIDGRLYESQRQPGAVTVVPRGHDGYRRWTGHNTVVSVFLDDARLQACADQIASGRPVELVDRVGIAEPIGFRILTLITEAVASDDPAARLFVEHLLELLCLHLLRAHTAIAAAPVAVRRGLVAWQVKRVLAYMRDHLADDIGLAELAGVVHLSRFHFCTAFRLATGQTPHERLIALRIARAQELLADPALQITDVALAVGYQTPSAFTASFRRVTGVTPTRFRTAIGR